MSDFEAARIRDLVAEHAGFAVEEAEAVAFVARNKTVALRGAENHRLTRRFNEISVEEERLHLIDCLYAVATSDDLVSHVEDREVRRIAAALMLPPSAVLGIRSRYREKLEELQRLRNLRGE
ncbi:MAG: TerB family tellurite resistance protein [Candidatus Binatia bacterium]